MQKVKPVLLLLVGMILIKIDYVFCQSKEGLINGFCKKLGSSQYQVLNRTFSVSDEIEDGKEFESVLFPIIKNGNLIAKNFADLMGEEVDFEVINNQIMLEEINQIPSSCKSKTIRKYPSKSKKYYSVKISNPVILNGKNKTIGFLIIRSTSNNAVLTTLTAILYEWNEESWSEIHRQELEFHD
ncbi:hypothetical protein [Algoriphagus litoralis]|uniref:hypothetical protein n=1 Tax=Algoriphagus litoralis TaxID=2202829 RepID=UPI000DB9A4A1|nr:hypothetical protein [Algoriphagus litoralis]